LRLRARGEGESQVGAVVGREPSECRARRPETRATVDYVTDRRVYGMHDLDLRDHAGTQREGSGGDLQPEI
jgi:hypothetical protein